MISLKPVTAIQLPKTIAEQFATNHLDILPVVPPRQTPITQSPEVLQASKNLQRAIDDFQGSSTFKDLKITTKVDCLQSNQAGLADAIRSLEEAQSRYTNVQDTGKRGKMRDWLRRCSELDGTISSWIRLLPSESWQASLLTGGIKVILTAAVRLEEVRDEIRNAIDQMALSMSSAERLSKVYPKAVDKFAKRLIVGNLEVMQACVQWFQHGAWKKFMGAVGRGKDYQKALLLKIGDLKLQQESLDRAANLELHERQGLFRENSHENHLQKRAEDHANHVQLEQIIRKTMADFLADREIFAFRQEQSQAQAMRRIQEQLQAREIKLQQIEQQKRWQQQQNEQDYQGARRQLAYNARVEILDIIGYDASIRHSDRVSCLKSGSMLAPAQQSRAMFILKSPEIGRWIADQQSSTLVINAQGEEISPGESTISFFSTMLIYALEDSAPGVVLHWFCNLRIRDTIAVMVSNLLGQLLETAVQHADLDDFQFPPGSLVCSYSNLKGLLCHFLRVQLRRTPVYCIIDSVDEYEDHRRVRDLLDLWAALNDIGQDDDPNQYPLKLLAISPNRSVHIGTVQDHAAAEALWVPPEIDGMEQIVDISYELGNAALYQDPWGTM